MVVRSEVRVCLSMMNRFEGDGLVIVGREVMVLILCQRYLGAMDDVVGVENVEGEILSLRSWDCCLHIREAGSLWQIVIMIHGNMGIWSLGFVEFRNLHFITPMYILRAFLFVRIVALRIRFTGDSVQISALGRGYALLLARV